MPGLKSDIGQKLSLTNKELEKYGEGLPEQDKERQTFLLKVSTRELHEKQNELFFRIP